MPLRALLSKENIPQTQTYLPTQSRLNSFKQFSRAILRRHFSQFTLGVK